MHSARPVPLNSESSILTNFSGLGLGEPLLKALAAEGYICPTPIQAQAIPLILSGRDVMGAAQTGTGKTAAFALPLLSHLISNPKQARPGAVRSLILSPTRELASQIEANIQAYARFTRVRSTVIFGGVSQGKQVQAMRQPVDILVATPGRLLDLIDQRIISLGEVEILVLDEADQMLDLGFIHALRRIAKLVPQKRQTLFFSATMPKLIREIASAYLTNPAEVAVTPVATTAEKVEQSVIFVNSADKPDLLARTLNVPELERAIVFTRTKHGADKVVRFLEKAGLDSAAIHGNKSQNQRERALGAFRDGGLRILVATDIAARGIDVDNVSHVVNYDLPNIPETYVHRIGRTARAGATGLAIAFCTPEERSDLAAIEKLTRIKLTPLGTVPSWDGRAAPKPPQRQGQNRGQQGRPQQNGRPQQGRPQQPRRDEPRDNGRAQPVQSGRSEAAPGTSGLGNVGFLAQRTEQRRNTDGVRPATGNEGRDRNKTWPKKNFSNSTAR